MAYDVQRLSRPPGHVVLSACDVGRTEVRPGDEILGFTAALLHLGTPTVISSVSRVDDETALAIMTAYHRALSAGARPAEALAQAGGQPSSDDDGMRDDAGPAGLAMDAALTPFVCFGAG
jgi:CHAT domain-containing protein